MGAQIDGVLCGAYIGVLYAMKHWGDFRAAALFVFSLLPSFWEDLASRFQSRDYLLTSLVLENFVCLGIACEVIYGREKNVF